MLLCNTVYITVNIFDLQGLIVLLCSTMNKVKTELLNFRTTEEIKSFLDEIANKYDRSVSYIINDFIKYFMENPPKSIPTGKKK